MASNEKQAEVRDELIAHYKPVAIKAVLAGCAIKKPFAESPNRVVADFGRLPEGFHSPQPIDE